MTKEGVEAVKKGMRKSILNAVFMVYDYSSFKETI